MNPPLNPLPGGDFLIPLSRGARGVFFKGNFGKYRNYQYRGGVIDV